MEAPTVVTATDAAHLRQLEVTMPTWRRNRPEMGDMPFLVIYDRDEVNEARVRDVFAGTWRRMPNLTCVPWPPVGLEYANQRGKMLAAYVHVPPEYVRTRYWVKVDTDVIAVHHDPRWIPLDFFGSRNVIAAPRWGYTKPANQMALLDEWGDGVPGLQDRPPLNLLYDPAGNKCPHSRFCSWVFWVDTAWSAEVAGYCQHGWLPVPSQDGYHFYCCARRGDSWAKYGAKGFGWTNTPRLAKLKQLAAAALDMGDEPSGESDTREYEATSAT